MLSDFPSKRRLSWTLFLSLLMTAVCVLGWSEVDGLSRLAAGREEVFIGHEYWRLLTALLVHQDPGHLLSNLLYFIIFGILLNSFFGPFVFPLLSLFSGAVSNFTVLYFGATGMSILGASGMVYSMAGFWIVLFILIERQRTLGARLLRGSGVGLALFFPQQAFEPHVSYLAHSVGFGLGVLTGIFYFFIFKKTIQRHEVWESDTDHQ